MVHEQRSLTCFIWSKFGQSYNPSNVTPVSLHDRPVSSPPHEQFFENPRPLTETPTVVQNPKHFFEVRRHQPTHPRQTPRSNAFNIFLKGYTKYSAPKRKRGKNHMKTRWKEIEKLDTLPTVISAWHILLKAFWILETPFSLSLSLPFLSLSLFPLFPLQ